MEAQVIGDLPRVIKLAMEPGLKPMGADTGVRALNHWTVVPWKSCRVKGAWRESQTSSLVYLTSLNFRLLIF